MNHRDQMAKRKGYDHLLNLVVVGDSMVGKTAMIMRYVTDVYDRSRYSATISADFNVKTVFLEGVRAKLQIWDTAGPERFYEMTMIVCRGVRGIFLMYDISNIKTFQTIPRWIDGIYKYADKGVVLMLIGAKADVEKPREVTTEEGMALAQRYGIQFMETSAKTGMNVDMAIHGLVSIILHKMLNQLDMREQQKTQRAELEKVFSRAKALMAENSSSDKLNTSPYEAKQELDHAWRSVEQTYGYTMNQLILRSNTANKTYTDEAMKLNKKSFDAFKKKWDEQCALVLSRINDREAVEKDQKINQLQQTVNTQTELVQEMMSQLRMAQGPQNHQQPQQQPQQQPEQQVLSEHGERQLSEENTTETQSSIQVGHINVDIAEILTIIQSESPLIDLEPEAYQNSSQNTSLHYALTETRGRALLISNKYDETGADGNTTWREGCQHDHENMKLMLQKFGFVTSGDVRNFTAKQIVETIHEETQLIDPTTHESVYRDLGVFVLVISSHGSRGSIVGMDRKHIDLADIFNLLSPKNFPAMTGKPKVIIIQACAGDKRDMMLDQCNVVTASEATVADQHNIAHMDHPEAYTEGVTNFHLHDHIEDDYFDIDSGNQSLTVADLMVIQSSFDAFVSPRSPQVGSPFIRALVTTFYRHAHTHHFEYLAKIVSMESNISAYCCAGIVVQESVSRYGVERTESYLRRSGANERAYVAQMPRVTCNPTGLREFYLKPGFNMRTLIHPHSFTYPINPEQPTTVLKWKPDTNVLRAEHGALYTCNRTIFLNWSVEKADDED